MTAVEPSLRIGLTRIYDKVLDIDEKLTILSCDLKALRSSTGEDRHDFDHRLATLETAAAAAPRVPWKQVAGVVGILGLIATVIGLIVSVK